MVVLEPNRDALPHTRPLYSHLRVTSVLAIPVPSPPIPAPPLPVASGTFSSTFIRSPEWRQQIDIA